MSQENGGMFSVRRPREVSIKQSQQRRKERTLTNSSTDTRPRQSQRFRDPHACLRHEAIHVEPKSPASASHDKPCAHNIRIAHVARAWQTITARIPALFFRRQLGELGLLDSAATEHRELLGQPDRQEELCACHEHAGAFAAADAGEHTETV